MAASLPYHSRARPDWQGSTRDRLIQCANHSRDSDCTKKTRLVIETQYVCVLSALAFEHRGRSWTSKKNIGQRFVFIGRGDAELSTVFPKMMLEVNWISETKGVRKHTLWPIISGATGRLKPRRDDGSMLQSEFYVNRTGEQCVFDDNRCIQNQYLAYYQ